MAELSCLEPHPESQALLISLVPPNIEPGLVNKAVLENASVTLECLASGVPPPGKQDPSSCLKATSSQPRLPSEEVSQGSRHCSG